jgi:hypothetical protein
VVDDKLREVDADLARVAAASAGDFMASLADLLACLRRHSDELQPPFLRDVGRETPELFASIQSRRRALIQRHVGSLLAEGRKRGLIRRDIDAGLMIEILLGATDGLVTPQRLAQLNLPAKTCLSAIVTIFLEGVVTRTERKPR